MPSNTEAVMFSRQPLSVRLLSTFLTEGAISGSVTRQPKNRSFLMSISASIEFNLVNLSRSARNKSFLMSISASIEFNSVNLSRNARGEGGRGAKSGAYKSFLRN